MGKEHWHYYGGFTGILITGTHCSNPPQAAVGAPKLLNSLDRSGLS